MKREEQGAEYSALTYEEAESAFFAWLDTEAEISREQVLADAKKEAFAGVCISAMLRGRLILQEGGARYILRFPIGNILDVQVSSRVKVKSSQISQKDGLMAQSLKVLEAHTNTPALVLQDLDKFDFNRLSAIAFFFV